MPTLYQTWLYFLFSRKMNPPQCINFPGWCLTYLFHNRFPELVITLNPLSSSGLFKMNSGLMVFPCYSEMQCWLFLNVYCNYVFHFANVDRSVLFQKFQIDYWGLLHTGKWIYCLNRKQFALVQLWKKIWKIMSLVITYLGFFCILYRFSESLH